jgi:hypothetical protein
VRNIQVDAPARFFKPHFMRRLKAARNGATVGDIQVVSYTPWKAGRMRHLNIAHNIAPF